MRKPFYKQLTVEQMNNLVNKCSSWKELARNLGYKGISGDLLLSLKTYVTTVLELDTSHFAFHNKKPTKRTSENVFLQNSTADQSTVRRHFLAQCTNYSCNICNQPPLWNGLPLTLILDHINGNNRDNRITNLRWVCPNCNMQLPTTNKQKKPKKIFRCIDCGAIITHQALRCKRCAGLHRYKK